MYKPDRHTNASAALDTVADDIIANARKVKVAEKKKFAFWDEVCPPELLEDAKAVRVTHASGKKLLFVECTSSVVRFELFHQKQDLISEMKKLGVNVINIIFC